MAKHIICRPNIAILATLSFLQLLKLEKQKCPQNLNVSIKNAISGHFKIFFEKLNTFILPISAENADSRGSTSHHPREQFLVFLET